MFISFIAIPNIITTSNITASPLFARNQNTLDTNWYQNSAPRHRGNLSFPTWADQMESASLSIQHLGSLIQHEARCCRVLDQTLNPGSLYFCEFFLSQSRNFYSLGISRCYLGKANWICFSKSSPLTWNWSPVNVSKRLGSAHDDCCAAIDLERSTSSHVWPTTCCGKRRSTRYQHHAIPGYRESHDAPI